MGYHYINLKKHGGWFQWANVTVPQIPTFFIVLNLVHQIKGIE